MRHKGRRMERIDAVVAGAGAVGLAIARALALTGREVLVLESEAAIGTATSSRNSEVIHAGIYYPPEFLKTRLCVDGRVALYRYCEERAVDHRKIGKLLLAGTKEEIPRLRALQEVASRNGVVLDWLTAKGVAELEPDVCCEAALWSPETGIVDSHALMIGLQGDLEAASGIVLLNAPVTRVDRSRSVFELEVGPHGDRLACDTFVNSAGLQAQELARKMSFLPAEQIPARRLVKGHYFYVSGRAPFKHLVYPLPGQAGLGIHVTLDIAGRVRFGPDAVPVDTIDYEFDENRAPAFIQAIERYYPDIRTRELRPGYTGIRPQLMCGQGGKPDFNIQGPLEHEIEGLVNLFGIESPGLTAALAIADYVTAILEIR